MTLSAKNIRSVLSLPARGTNPSDSILLPPKLFQLHWEHLLSITTFGKNGKVEKSEVSRSWTPRGSMTPSAKNIRSVLSVFESGGNPSDPILLPPKLFQLHCEHLLGIMSFGKNGKVEKSEVSRSWTPRGSMTPSAKNIRSVFLVPARGTNPSDSILLPPKLFQLHCEHLLSITTFGKNGKVEKSEVSRS